MIEGWKTRGEYERLMEHDKWQTEIPNLKFPADWEIKIIPPFAGAVVRFIVFKGGKRVSVYLDCYGNLGNYGFPNIEPYWEIYPATDNDIWRCAMLDTENLIAEIAKSLE